MSPGRRVAAPALALAAALALHLALSGAAVACFGARLRVGVPPDRGHALAAYAAGYYVEEKTGIEPEFVALPGGAAEALAEGAVDLCLGPEGPAPAGSETRPTGDVPGVGPGRFWIRGDVLDDLRFFTVDRALGQLPAFFGSEAFREAAASSVPARKAARQAVHRAD